MNPGDELPAFQALEYMMENPLTEFEWVDRSASTVSGDRRFRMINLQLWQIYKGSLTPEFSERDWTPVEYLDLEIIIGHYWTYVGKSNK